MPLRKTRGWFKGGWPRANGKRQKSPYHAVSIRCSKRACSAAQNAEGQRYLSAEAPKLPLTGCNRPEHCECRFEHHDDRRSEPRRAADIGLPAHGSSDGADRRKQRGRRATDHVDELTDTMAEATDYFEHTSTIIRKRSELAATPSDATGEFGSGSTPND